MEAGEPVRDGRPTPASSDRERAACPACGYSLQGLRGPVCPECGGRIDPARLRPRPVGWTRASRAALAGIVLGAACAALILMIALVRPGPGGPPAARIGFSGALLAASAAGLWAWGRWGGRVLSWPHATQARLASAVWLTLGAVTILAVWLDVL